ncbi:MAG: hypothetical protein NTU47_02795 [Ignavibacteriales bacterium]|nr:hypothetical protein [Ignavibacteriales bacterium]
MNSPSDFERSLSPSEARLLPGLSTPARIQAFLDTIEYSEEERYRCPLTVLRDRKGHCFDGALFAAAMLRRIGHPPLITDIIPNDNDDDHILALYKVRGHWGAVAKSNYTGLRYREPVFRTLRELIMSYFEVFFNAVGEKTMRAYTRPLNLASFDRLGWMTHDEALDAIGEKLDDIRKIKPLTPAMIRALSYADERSVQAGLLGAKAAGLFKAVKRAPRST